MKTSFPFKSKARFLFFLIILLCLFWVGTAEARTYYYDSIDVKIRVNPDSTFDVEETMTYNLNGDFGYFYRDIELKDLDHITNVEVYDNNRNRLEEYDLSYKGNKLYIQWNFPRRDYDNELKSWAVKYKVHGGLGFFDNYDELYWNAVGSDREVLVKQAKVEVVLPEQIDDLKARMFIGYAGTKNEYNDYEINGNKVIFTREDISPNQYLTIVASWPKGFVTKPFLYRNQAIILITLLIALLIPLIIFIRAFKVWFKKGKDPRIKKTIIAHYEPPNNLEPAVIGVLTRQDVNIKDILATVVNLAVRGYLKIREEENKFLFIKSKEYIFEKIKQDENLKPFEAKIMNDLFEKGDVVSSNDLKKKFYKNIPGIKKEIHREISQTGLFDANIQKTRKKYIKPYIFIIVLAVIIFFASVMIIKSLGLNDVFIICAIILGLSLALSSVIGITFALFMPVLTDKGLEAKWQALGFKEYLQTAERFRIGTETLETFSKFLPYAMVFGVEKQWAKRFDDFSYKQQNWYYPAAVYSGQGRAPASFGEFGSSFSSFASSVSSTFSSAPGGSGAGGAAGGGGGGGGGGAG